MHCLSFLYLLSNPRRHSRIEQLIDDKKGDYQGKLTKSRKIMFTISAEKLINLKLRGLIGKTEKPVMTSTEYSNPFTPGFGAIPPYLAGRADEQDLFRYNLATISAGKSPPAATVLYGPRGMGKTVLLSWFKDEVEQTKVKKNRIRVVWITPHKLKSQLDLWNSLLPPPSWFKKRFLKKIKASIKVEEITATAGLEMGESVDQEFENTLIKKNKNRPLILLLDEAHKMDPDICNQLLNAYQIVSKEMPFMLVLAGTPGLHNFLSGVKATFVERSEMIGLGRLDEQASADAISKPLAEQGIQITDEALSIIVEDSQCYPYFLQVWGKSIWTEADKTNLTCITEEQVGVVKQNTEIIKQKFYDERRDTLDVLRLESTAIAIAQAFQDTKSMTKGMIKEIIADNLSVDSLNTQSDVERLQTFINQDFIWRPLGSVLYEPGIPSLMTHILNQQPSVAKTK